jgi:uncharacterized protein YprB with RNaseH-like and TPR domain
MQSTSTDLTSWLTTTLGLITRNLINEFEYNIINETHIMHNERKIKHKCKPAQISFLHAEHHLKILLVNMKTNLLKEFTKLENNKNTLFTSMSAIQSHRNIFNHDQSPQITPPFKTMLDISNMNLITSQLQNLSGKIIFFDLETDGLSINNSNILEMSMHQIDLLHTNFHKRKILPWSIYIKPHSSYQINTKSEAFKINGITQQQINSFGQPIYFKDIFPTIEKLFSNKIICGYNINKFDIPILKNHCKKINKTLPPFKTLDLYQVYNRFHKNNLQSALNNLNCDPILKSLEHTANGDADACIRLLASMTSNFNLPKTLEEYTEFKNNPLNKGHFPLSQIYSEFPT